MILTLVGDRRSASLTTPKVLRRLQYHNNLLTRFKRASRPFFNGHNAPDLGKNDPVTAQKPKSERLCGTLGQIGQRGMPVEADPVW